MSQPKRDPVKALATAQREIRRLRAKLGTTIAETATDSSIEALQSYQQGFLAGRREQCELDARLVDLPGTSDRKLIARAIRKAKP